MITVAGEALVDLVPFEGGALGAHPGGAPFNVARLTAQLGQPTTYLGRLSEDPFGQQLRAALAGAGVTLAVPEPVSAPTPLAVAQLDAGGSADYRFYFEATAGSALTHVPAGLLQSGDVFALGGLGIVYEPVASTLEALVRSAPADVTVVFDPNCRPRAITDLDGYLARVGRILERTDVLKVSAEDLELLTPGLSLPDAGEHLRSRGPTVVLITDGPDAVLSLTEAGVHAIPVPPAQVVDTIGAGDAFLSGILAWFATHPDVDPRGIETTVLERAVTAATTVSAAVCSMGGATLPPGFSWTGANP